MKKIFILIVILGVTSILNAQTAVSLQNATASATQTGVGSTAGSAIDGNSSTNWQLWRNGSDTGPWGTRNLAVETVSDLSLSANQGLQFTVSQSFLPAAGFRFYYTTDLRSNFADGLSDNGNIGTSWTLLTPVSVSDNQGGITYSIDVNSVYLNEVLTSSTGSGSNPNQFTNTVVSFSDLNLSNVTGFRMEVIDNPNTPTVTTAAFHGSNVHISEFSIDVVAIPEPSTYILLVLSGVFIFGFSRRWKLT